MRVLIFTVWVVFWGFNVWSDPVTLIESESSSVGEYLPKEKYGVTQAPAVGEAQAAITDYAKTQEFMAQTNDRLKAIRILNLDIERADLELKREEIEAKRNILRMGRDAQTVRTIDPDSQENPVSVKLAGIFYGKDVRRAMVSVNGDMRDVQEGRIIFGNVKVKAIEADAIILEGSDGTQERIAVGL